MRAPLRVGIFGLAIFTSATLIFLVQPLVGKRILPWFGGAPAVWTLCLAFYQTTLFFGYAYAHALVRFARPAWQVAIHLVVLAAAALSLPVLPTEDARPAAGAAPESEILWVLVLHVALPFLALAATGPLVQVWFAVRHPTRSPYFLYAVSNVGSLLGLLGYSFFLESALSVSVTGQIWSYAFVVCGSLVVTSGLVAARADGLARPNPARAVDRLPTDDAVRPDAGQQLVWAGLAGSAVILLTGLTNQLTLDVASVPFLWVWMLAAYLLSFILAFASERAYARGPFLAIAGLLLFGIYAPPLLGSLGAWLTEATQPLLAQIILYAALLFFLATVLHGELYRLRPATPFLTRFYLCVSGGGALGGLFSGIVAPHLFSAFHEVATGLVLGWLAVLVAWRARAAIDAMGWTRRRRVATAALGTFVVVVPQIAGLSSPTDAFRIHQERSFFGVLRVLDWGEDVGQPQRGLTNGTTAHGRQLLGEGLRERPTSYFGVLSGIGFALATRGAGESSRVGIIGLGIGTLAAYGRDGDLFRFYELDPAVARIARDDGYFTYLEDSAAAIEVVIGDARLSLETEAARGDAKFDVLVVDAFTSDSIPVHLMTREAFELYDRRLEPNGLLAIHVSNRYFKLDPVVARLGASVGLETRIFQNRSMPDHATRLATWALLSRDPARLEELAREARRTLRGRRLPPSSLQVVRLTKGQLEDVPLWTDDYTDLLAALQ